ncbi:MAG: YggS family pyridoxal phosphate-dependent enzyme [Ruminococcaceae bacterium]|nr:YggS family pyridoxal phosphate-dependent enzyme [Oscillospiraceae bacterium]
MAIQDNIRRIRAEMEAAALAAGRDPKTVQLCAATKMNDAQAVRAAIAGGVDRCGENRVQELTAKQAEDAYAGAPVDFIGHLQTNKVRQVVGKVDLIQSVDSLRLLEAIAKEAARQGIRQDVLLEVNIGGEESKSGFAPGEIPGIVEKFPVWPHLRLRGLMAIPPKSEKSGDNVKFFQEMYNLSVDITAKKSDNVCIDTLSMGMSDDFADAIRYGSTMIRVGTAIFGARMYTKPQQQ